MKTGRLIAAAIILAALGATLYWSNHRKASAETTAAVAGPPNIISLKPEDVSKLEIKKKGGDDVALTRVGPNDWKIVSPKSTVADEGTVSTILSDLFPLQSDQLIEEKASDLKPYGLDSPSLELSATGKDGKSQKIILGDDTPAGSMTYAMLEGDPRIFTIGDGFKAGFDKSFKDLRDKRLLPVDFEKAGKVELTGPKLNLTFGFDNGKWRIQSPKDMRADTTTLGGVVEKLQAATMDSGTSDADMKKSASLFSSGTPVATIKVADSSGPQVMQIRKNKYDYYAKSTASDGVYKISMDLGEFIDKTNEDFRDKWLLDLREDNPDKVELQDGSKSHVLTRSGDDWWSDGKKMDIMTVQDFISNVRGLTATKFATSGFSNPSISLTVTSNGGKRVEKVQIAKNGNDYLAKREDAPLLYELETKSVDGLLKSADSLTPAAPPAPAKK